MNAAESRSIRRRMRKRRIGDLVRSISNHALDSAPRSAETFSVTGDPDERPMGEVLRITDVTTQWSAFLSLTQPLLQN